MTLVWMVAASACGRIGFNSVDPTGDALAGVGIGSDGPFGDGPPAVSCGTLAPTCGPTGTSPCCESPVVTGSMFSRSYDVSGDGDYPDPSYTATVSTFRLDKYEATVGRFRQFVLAGQGTQASPPVTGAGARTLNGSANQSGWDAMWNGNLNTDQAALTAALKCNATYQTWTDTPDGNENRPMNCITWYEAMAFCIWDGGFLPTEAEWNYAAAGGAEQRAYPWSSPPAFLGIDTRASYYSTDCLGDGMAGCALTDLVPVGSKPAGDGLWGQSDLGGNVWEWVLDWHASPYANPCTDCANLTPASFRVLRGGDVLSVASLLRGAVRRYGTPADRYLGLGARCGRTP